MFKPKEINLYIIAHPDDELFGLGGTILKNKLTFDDLNIIIMCTSVPNRDKSFRLVCDELDISLKIELGQKNFDIDKFELEKCMTDHIKNITSCYDIDNVFTHNRDDIHIDHQMVHDVAFLLFRPHKFKCKNFLTFETYDSSNNGYSYFHPNIFNDISFYVDRKIQLLEKYYKSELKNSRDTESIKYHMKHYGSLVDKKYCEVFKNVRSIIC